MKRFALIGLLACLLPACLPAHGLTYQTKLIITGSTEQQGEIVDVVSGARIPNVLSLQVLITRASNGAAYARLVMTLPGQWKAMSSTSLAVTDWGKITSQGAEFRFTVLYTYFTDRAIFIIRRLADGRWSLDLTIKNAAETLTKYVRPTSYLPPGAVVLTP